MISIPIDKPISGIPRPTTVESQSVLMPRYRYRSAPPLLPLVEARSALELFHDFFVREGRAPIVGPEGRIVLFSRKLGTYQAFVKAFQSSQWGKPVQRFSWIEDTLGDPSAIWRQAGNPRAAEFFASFYLIEETNLIFVVKTALTNEGPPVVVDPTGYQILRDEDELQRLVRNGPPCWASPQFVSSKSATKKEPISWRVCVHYGPINERKDPKSWTRHFLVLEANHPNIRIIPVEVGEPADYWVLDTNTTDYHADTGGFQADARAAGAIPLAVNTPSNLVVKETDDRTYLFSMRRQARE